MANGRHSYIQFYPSDWLAGTARLPRLLRSVYFDVCLHNWDSANACPPLEVSLIISDLPDGALMIDQLVQMGKLVRNEDGSLYNPRALAEGARAFAAWEAMSQGGKGARKGVDKGDGKGASSGMDKNQNQNQNHILPPIAPPQIFDAWNAMASECGLALATKLNDRRKIQAKARLDEHGGETIIAVIGKIPESPFLLGRNDRGWKANFDWLLQPSSMQKLIEGNYHGRNGRGVGWLDA